MVIAGGCGFVLARDIRTKRKATVEKNRLWRKFDSIPPNERVRLLNYILRLMGVHPI